MAWNPDHYKLQTYKTVGSSAGGFTVNHIKKRKLMKKDSNVMDSKRVFIILSILLLITWLTMEETEAQFEGPIGKKRRRRRCRLKRRCSRKRRHRNDAGTQQKQGLANQKLSWTNQLTTYALHFNTALATWFFFCLNKKVALLEIIFFSSVPSYWLILYVNILSMNANRGFGHISKSPCTFDY